jgi:hypothetical protein
LTGTAPTTTAELNWVVPGCRRRLLYGAAAESSTRMKWANGTFVKTCQLQSMLSGYPNLTLLYSLFCCLAVSSDLLRKSFEQAEIVKKRVHSSLCNDMLSALLVLASEKDLLAKLSNISIISHLTVANVQFTQSALAVYIRIDSRL